MCNNSTSSLRSFIACRPCLNLAIVLGLTFLFMRGPGTSFFTLTATANIEAYENYNPEEKSDNEEQGHSFELSSVDYRELDAFHTLGARAHLHIQHEEKISAHYLDINSPPPEA